MKTAKEIYDSMSKSEVFDLTRKYYNGTKLDEWLSDGIDLVIGKREGYYFWDMDGKKLMDVHINGGTYSLGHRNPEVIQALKDALEMVDMGNHHFTSPLKALLAEKLIEVSPDNMRKVVYGSSGGEAVDLALKCARQATGRRKIVSIRNAYHGHTGLAVAAGADRYSKLFLVDRGTDEFEKVTFNEIDEMEAALSKGDVACVIMETIPATYGFPMPKDGYLKAVKELCEKYGTLYIADEVQTGLMRSGEMWCITKYGVTPDIIVTSKGLSGGIYPISAVILSDKACGWMEKDGSGHMSTYGGSELGCVCALKTLDIISRPATKSNIDFISKYLREGLDKIVAKSEKFRGVRQNGTIMGLEFEGEKGAIPVMESLYKNGVWAIYSQLDPSIIQFKPGILCTKEYCDELLEKMEKGILEVS
ncbi:MAG: aminotransferase class III-fold pyridoxal phosphate-dependent enzyme [Lachnospiraceae bacterium]|nr:aminotransferase class III-fold pyridoxal phosphate-dependent enzyme [Lachnospiraceae bacterium]